jgi:transcription elongation factor GreA
MHFLVWFNGGCHDEQRGLFDKGRYYEIQERLEYLKTQKRREIAEKIKVARDFGDLSENAEYEEAQNRAGFHRGRNSGLEYKIKNASIIGEQKGPKGIVHVGAARQAVGCRFQRETEYTIVGSDEADLDLKRISNESRSAAP